jgi:hypothetical protein
MSADTDLPVGVFFVTASSAADLLGVDPIIILAEAGGDEISIKALKPLADRLEARGVSIEPKWQEIGDLTREENRMRAGAADGSVHIRFQSAAATIKPAAVEDDDDQGDDDEDDIDAGNVNVADAPLTPAEAAEAMDISEDVLSDLCDSAGLDVDDLHLRDFAELSARKVWYDAKNRLGTSSAGDPTLAFIEKQLATLKPR